MSLVMLAVDDGVAVVTLSRPDRLNAISGELTRDLNAVLAQAQSDPRVRVIVLTGAGRAFCAGDDLKEFDLQTASKAAIDAHIEGIQDVTRNLMLCDKFVVGAIHGYAVGGGFEWLLNCDMVVAADDLVAFFPEMEWGQFVTGAVTHLLPLVVGYQRAMELFVLGERQKAADLLALGIVNRVVPQAAMVDTAMEIARKAAAKSAPSVAALKRLLTTNLGDPIRSALKLETAEAIASFQRSDAAERVQNFQRRRG